MAEGTGDLTESKARNPRLRAEPTSDTPCPPRGPHHPVLTASPSLSRFLFALCLSVFISFSLPLSRARARALVYISRCALAPLPRFARWYLCLCRVLPPFSASSTLQRPSPRACSPSGRPQFAVSTASLPSRRADLPLRRLPGVTARALRHGYEVMNAGLPRRGGNSRGIAATGPRLPTVAAFPEKSEIERVVTSEPSEVEVEQPGHR